jgi:hypothetical protein
MRQIDHAMTWSFSISVGVDSIVGGLVKLKLWNP